MFLRVFSYKKPPNTMNLEMSVTFIGYLSWHYMLLLYIKYLS